MFFRCLSRISSSFCCDAEGFFAAAAAAAFCAAVVVDVEEDEDEEDAAASGARFPAWLLATAPFSVALAAAFDPAACAADLLEVAAAVASFFCARVLKE